MRDMVLDAPCIGHARGTDDDSRLFRQVELLGHLYVADIMQPVEPKWVFVGEEVLGEVFVKTLWVCPVDGRCIDGEGAVHIYWDAGQVSKVLCLVEQINDFLGAPDPEGGDDEFAPFF